MIQTPLVWTEERLRDAISCNFSTAAVLRHLNMCVAGGNYRTLYKYIKIYNIDISHFDPFYYAKVTPDKKLIPLDKILVRNSTYSNNGNIKRRMIAEGLLENKCYICGQLPFHNNKPLILQLDHINGINNDHRRENLRLLCPNCHTQTGTYGSKRGTNPNKIIKVCLNCKKSIYRTATYCKDCIKLKNKCGRSSMAE